MNILNHNFELRQFTHGLSAMWCTTVGSRRPSSGSILLLLLPLFLMLPATGSAQYTVTVCQSESDAVVDADRNAFANQPGQWLNDGYLHNFDPPVLPCGIVSPSLTSLTIEINLSDITTSTDCIDVPIFGNVLLNTPINGVRDLVEDILSPGCRLNWGTGSRVTGVFTENIAACNTIGANDVIGVDMIPGTANNPPGPACLSNTAVADGDISLEYQICLTYVYDQDSNPPEQPVLTCDPTCTDEIEFTWTSVNATFYDLFLSINGAPEVQVGDDVTGTTYTATGLNPGDIGELRVVPFSGAPSNSCVGPDASTACTTPLTLSPGFIVGFPAVVCADGTGTTFDLSVSAGEAGTFTLNSGSLGLTNLAADPSGVTSISVPSLIGGPVTEVHQIVISYANAGGTCPADTTIELTATRPPPADFSLDQTSVCAAAGTFTATLNNPVESGATYDLQLASRRLR